MSLIQIINFQALGDERGSLVALESSKNIKFDIKRVYYIFGTKENVSRGFHAHINLEQILICLSGECRIVLDDGFVRSDVKLDKPTQGLKIKKMIWHEMHELSSNCVLLVLASEYYSEIDYIRNYSKFIELANYDSYSG